MALEKSDFKSIEKMFDQFEKRISKRIEAVETGLGGLEKEVFDTKTSLKKDIFDTKTELKKDIFNVEDKLTAKMEASENKVIAVISREVNDLAEINHEVIKRVDRIDELDKRLSRVEAKMGIKPV